MATAGLLAPTNHLPSSKRSGKVKRIPPTKRSADVQGVLNHKKIHSRSMVRLDDRPETSPEVTSECLKKVEIALLHGNEEQAVAAIRYAFANGLCPSEPHDPRELSDDEPLAATSLGGGAGVKNGELLVRLLDTLERYGFLTVGQVRSVGYAGIMKLPFISNRCADVIAEAVGMSVIAKKVPTCERRRPTANT